jgi:predicted alpha-1,2-mannosidase
MSARIPDEDDKGAKGLKTRRECLTGAAAAALAASGLGVAGAVAEGALAFDPCRHVDPFIGTGGHGHTFPGALTPFGMVQLSPDTDNARWDACSGYHFGDSTILGFSHTHLSGTGVGDMMDVLVVPNVGPVVLSPGTLAHPEGSYRARYDHASERASPGYYRVLLKDRGIEAELTATPRVGLHRYRFDPAKAVGGGHLLIDFRHGAEDEPAPGQPEIKTRVTKASLRLIGNDTLVGTRSVNQWADGRVIHFAMKLSRPFARAELYSDDTHQADGAQSVAGVNLKCALFYPDAAAAPLLVKCAVSGVDIEGALNNLAAEMPGWDFDAVHRRARAAWTKELSKVRLEGGSEADRTIFYTAYYHTLIAPSLFSDVDGRYMGMNTDVQTLSKGANNYSTYSLWDTYRALHPLFTLVQSERNADLVQGLVRMTHESPVGPSVWPLQGKETNTMIGWHSAVVVAEAASKRVDGVDFAAAWPAFRKRAFEDRVSGMEYYRSLGFIPSDKVAEAASKTLEIAYDDWAISKLADAVGAAEDAHVLRERSKNYRNLFDSKLNFVRPRLANGDWAEPFDPRALGHDSPKWHDFTECNAWEATFLNQHDIYGYMALFGGDRAFEAKLDGLFNASSALLPDAPPDMTGMVGQYCHGNEPGHHAAYLYAYTGAHYKTQARVRMLLKTQHQAAPDGLAGNEDCGQMSAWYVMSAMGLYAVDPVSAIYVFGSPLFKKVELQVAPGKTLAIEAPLTSEENIYIQSATWNGRPYRKTWIAHADLIQGGRLVFEMGPKPNLAYGAAMEDRPPSFV